VALHELTHSSDDAAHRGTTKGVTPPEGSGEIENPRRRSGARRTESRCGGGEVGRADAPVTWHGGRRGLHGAARRNLIGGAEALARSPPPPVGARIGESAGSGEPGSRGALPRGKEGEGGRTRRRDNTRRRPHKRRGR